MKVNYKKPIRTYRGKKDGLVYYYHPGLERSLAREYVVPRATENNRKLRAVTQNLQELNPSPGYRDDLKVYIHLLKSHAATEHVFRGHYWNLYLKLMWAMAKVLNLDLEDITREQILTRELPCRTVKSAVEAGLLIPVSGFEMLVREF